MRIDGELRNFDPRRVALAAQRIRKNRASD